MGIQLSMDDFGTGYSSLNNLRHFPIGSIKIDRSFVARMMKSDEDHMIVRTIIDLAHNLGMQCIAEGVETDLQREELKKLGCDRAQGTLFAKPMTAEQATELISRGDRVIASTNA